MVIIMTQTIGYVRYVYHPVSNAPVLLFVNLVSVMSIIFILTQVVLSTAHQLLTALQESVLIVNHLAILVIKMAVLVVKVFYLFTLIKVVFLLALIALI
jgi:hypothetical protein